MMGTGGGSPKELELPEIENALLNFLTPDASGLKNLPEGGFTNDMQSYDYNETWNSFALSNTEEKDKDIFLLDTSNDTILHEMHSPIQQNKQHSTNKHMQLLSRPPLNSNTQNIHAIGNYINSVCIRNFLKLLLLLMLV